MTHEDFVNFEQAKALKELGFDWKVFFQFNYRTKEIEPNEGNSYSEGGPFDTYDVLEDVTKYGCIPAPTLAQAQKWLREIKGKIIIPCVMHIENIMKYDFYIADEPIDLFDYSDGFDTYEQALSAGIDKALEFLKSEDK